MVVRAQSRLRKEDPVRLHSLAWSNHFKSPIYILILAVVILFQASPSVAEEGMTVVETPVKSPILSACEYDYPPFCLVDPEGTVNGYSIELMRAALAAMGREATFRTGIWTDVKSWLLSGQIQALPLVARTQEREATMDFTFPYMSLHGAIVVRKETTGISKLSDLTGRKVGVMRGDNVEEFLLRTKIKMDLQSVPTFEVALRDLSEGRNDAVVILQLVAIRLIQEMGLKNLRIINDPIEGFSQDFCFAVKEGDRDTLALLNEGLALVTADGTSRHLHAKWFAALELPYHRGIVVGGDDDYPPFEYLDENGKPAGYNVEITQAIARELGLSIEIRLAPWNQIIKGLEKGEIDVIQGMFYSPERDAKFDFSQPHAVNHCVSVTRKGSGVPPATLEELSGNSIVVQHGDIMHDYLVENHVTAQITALESQKDALVELAGGKYDCALVARLSALFWIDKLGLDNLVVGQNPLLSPEYCYAVPNNQRPLLAHFSEGLKVIENTGEYRHIYEKWMGVYEYRRPSLTAILKDVAVYIVPFLFILLASITWTWSLRKQVAHRTEALRHSADQFRSIIEGAPEAIFIQTRFLFSYMNSSAYRLLGAESPDQLLGTLVVDRVRPEMRSIIQERMEKLNSGKKSVPTMEEIWLRLDGKEIPVEVSAVPISYEGEDGALVFMRDLRERKLRDEERARLLHILESSLNEIYVFDSNTLKFEYVNQAALSNLGYPLDVMYTMTPVDLKPEFTEESFRLGITPLLNHELKQLIFKTVHQRADGSQYPVEVHLQLVVLEGQRVFLAVIVDITDRQKTEYERDRLMAAIEQASETIFITDPDGFFQYVNPAFVTATGYTRDEVIGKTPSILKSGKHDPSFYLSLWDTISNGRTWSGRIINKRKDGSLCTDETTISPVFDPAGTICNYVTVKRDITDHLRLEEQFRQAQKMDSVGRLAGGVAHDFNNNLQVILGYTAFALKNTQPDQPLHQDLKEVEKAALHSANLTRQLLAFARKQTVAPEVLDLNDTVEGMLKMLRRLIGEDIDLAWIPGPSLWMVKIDPSQIDQIMANLCVNSRDAISGNGKVTIETRNITLVENSFPGQVGFTPGDYVMLAVSDDGCGMDTETLEKVFEPFFTTKEVGQGTGLGLATVYGIVKQNNGYINVYSEIGQGTTFKLYLPRHHGEVARTQEADMEIIPQGKGETILLVEDEASILMFARRILTGAGYNVLAANTPISALRIAEEHSGPIQLLVTDVVMPEMNGRELARRLQNSIPDLKCLFISGYTSNVIVHRGILDEGTQFLQKPFTIMDFATKVREELDRE